MIKVITDGQIWGLASHRCICFLFCGNRTMFSWDIAHLQRCPKLPPKSPFQRGNFGQLIIVHKSSPIWRYWSFVRRIHWSPVTWSFDVFFDLRLDKQLSKQSRHWWFEMPSCSLWHHCNENFRSLRWTVLSGNWLALSQSILWTNCILGSVFKKQDVIFIDMNSKRPRILFNFIFQAIRVSTMLAKCEAVLGNFWCEIKMTSLTSANDWNIKHFSILISHHATPVSLDPAVSAGVTSNFSF